MNALGDSQLVFRSILDLYTSELNPKLESLRAAANEITVTLVKTKRKHEKLLFI